MCLLFEDMGGVNHVNNYGLGSHHLEARMESAMFVATAGLFQTLIKSYGGTRNVGMVVRRLRFVMAFFCGFGAGLTALRSDLPLSEQRGSTCVGTTSQFHMTNDRWPTLLLCPPSCRNFCNFW